MSGSAQDALAALARGRAGEEPQPWLAERRVAGAARLEELGLPTTRNEDWRFTSLDGLDSIDFASGEAPPGEAEILAHASHAAVGECHRLVFVNGRFSRELSSLGGLPSGVQVEPLSHALEQHGDRVQAVLGSVADGKSRAFTALNDALLQDGVFIEVRRGQRVSEPVHAVYVQTASGVSAPRNLVNAHPGSELVLVEHYVGTPAVPALVAPVTEIHAQDDARVTHVVLQEQPQAMVHVGEVAARQERGSQLRSHSLALGAGLGRIDLRALLLGEGAHAALLGLYLANGRQQLDHHTTIDHAAPHTTSEERYKGILGDRAHGVFHGRIHVRPDAQKISAEQSNRNLLLSDGARLNTKPQLEIYADDVKCSHGATIGRLDDDHLFYLRARGISEEAARALLTLAFANEIATGLPVPELGAYLTYWIRRWLPGGPQ